MCDHPANRLFAGTARDDTRPNGLVFWIACCDCGEVIYEGDPNQGKQANSARRKPKRPVHADAK